MRLARAALLIATVLAAAGNSPASAANPSEAYSKGTALVEKGELYNALLAYADAVRGDRANGQYMQQFMLVRQAYQLQDALGKEQNTLRWVQIAQALRSFYTSQGVFSQALELDLGIHKRENSAESAVLLAETQLALGRNADAAQTLATLDAAKKDPATQALLAIALVRQEELQQARTIAKAIDLPEDSGPGTLYCVARARAVVGDKDEALKLLTRCFEATPPSRLMVLKSHAKEATEFSSLASTPRFAEVMQTASKIAESKCSGGSSCAGCPMRAQCESGGSH